MKTTFEEELKKRSLEYMGINSIEEIAVGGSLIPGLYEDEDHNILEVIFCESISGGMDETNHMPNRLNLTKLLSNKNSLETFNGEYVLLSNDRVLKEINDIDTSIEGKYLKAAIDILASTNYPYDSKEDILNRLNIIVNG